MDHLETQEVQLQTLEEFMAMVRWPLNAFVAEPGFEELYVRKSVRMLGGEPRKVLDIARVKAWDPGKGTFTRFSERMLSMGRHLYVESVMNPRFERKLLDLGFTQHETNPSCYYKLANV
jgi:hypothetical protein